VAALAASLVGRSSSSSSSSNSESTGGACSVRQGGGAGAASVVHHQQRRSSNGGGGDRQRCEHAGRCRECCAGGCSAVAASSLAGKFAAAILARQHAGVDGVGDESGERLGCTSSSCGQRRTTRPRPGRCRGCAWIDRGGSRAARVRRGRGCGHVLSVRVQRATTNRHGMADPPSCSSVA
jgi:hypothetical protein